VIDVGLTRSGVAWCRLRHIDIVDDLRLVVCSSRTLVEVLLALVPDLLMNVVRHLFKFRTVSSVVDYHAYR
jgi:hypothetical protein